MSQVGRYGNIASGKIEKQVALGHQLLKLILHTPQRHVQMHKTHFLSSPQSVLGPLMYRTKQASARWESWDSKITLGYLSTIDGGLDFQLVLEKCAQ